GQPTRLGEFAGVTVARPAARMAGRGGRSGEAPLPPRGSPPKVGTATNGRRPRLRPRCPEAVAVTCGDRGKGTADREPVKALAGPGRRSGWRGGHEPPCRPGGPLRRRREHAAAGRFNRRRYVPTLTAGHGLPGTLRGVEAQPEIGRGRPPKATAERAEAPEPKRPRGRPRKGR